MNKTCSLRIAILQGFLLYCVVCTSKLQIAELHKIGDCTNDTYGYCIWAMFVKLLRLFFYRRVSGKYATYSMSNSKLYLVHSLYSPVTHY